MSSRAQKAERLSWVGIREALDEKDIILHGTPEECDISVVLGGCFENPLPLRGTKVLALKQSEWGLISWKDLYEQVVEEYYDHIIDTTGLSPTGTLRLIEKECKKLA